MRIPDRRPAIRRSAWLSTSLTWREKAYLVRVTELPAETDPETGRRRYGSKAMDDRGHFALHLDYVARMLGTSPAVVKKTQEACAAKGYLSLVHPAAFGRPSTHHALIRKEGQNRGRYVGQNVPPYEQADPTTSGDETSLLTYRDGTDPATCGSRGLSPRADASEAGREARHESRSIGRPSVDHLPNEGREERTA